MILLTPSTTLQAACSKYGINLSPTGKLLLSNLLFSPLPAIGVWIFDKIEQKKKEDQEKERIKNELIRKQQAIIQRLQRGDELNKQEIKNLKDTLGMLEDAIS